LSGVGSLACLSHSPGQAAMHPHKLQRSYAVTAALSPLRIVEGQCVVRLQNEYLV
jgi:hypothetical protein